MALWRGTAGETMLPNDGTLDWLLNSREFRTDELDSVDCGQGQGQGQGMPPLRPLGIGRKTHRQPMGISPWSPTVRGRTSI